MLLLVQKLHHKLKLAYTVIACKNIVKYHVFKILFNGNSDSEMIKGRIGDVIRRSNYSDDSRLDRRQLSIS